MGKGRRGGKEKWRDVSGRCLFFLSMYGGKGAYVWFVRGFVKKIADAPFVLFPAVLAWLGLRDTTVSDFECKLVFDRIQYPSYHLPIVLPSPGSPFIYPHAYLITGTANTIKTPDYPAPTHRLLGLKPPWRA